MAEFKIAAGAKLEMVTPGEMKEIMKVALSDAAVESRRGRRFREFSKTGTPASSAVSITGRDLGPDNGFTWSVKRITVVGLTANDIVGVFRNSTETLSAVEAIQATAAAPWPFFGFGSRQLIVRGGEKLVIANVGTLATTGTISVMGLAEEVPANMEWLL